MALYAFRQVARTYAGGRPSIVRTVPFPAETCASAAAISLTPNDPGAVEGVGGTTVGSMGVGARGGMMISPRASADAAESTG